MRSLNSEEKKWIDLICVDKIQDIDVLKEQISNSYVEEIRGADFISVIFTLYKKSRKYTHDVRVPVEMRVFMRDRSPVLFLLHVIDGIISELEIFTADSSNLDLDNLSFENIEYIIDKKR